MERREPAKNNKPGKYGPREGPAELGHGPLTPTPDFRGLGDDTSPEAIRLTQQEDIREALKAGAKTIAELSEETFLSAFSVEMRLKERPDWFRSAGGKWQEALGAA